MSDRAFEQLVGPYRDELRLHCYRMLGSSHDADDMVQETLVRAWRAKGSLHDPRAVRAWLYRIGTNVCIDELARRPKRAVPASAGPPAIPTLPRFLLRNRHGLSPVPTHGWAHYGPTPPRGSS